MVAPLILLLLAGPADSLAATAGDSTAVPPRKIVREFPPITVEAPLHDMRSSETVHEISQSALRSLPVDRLRDLVALKAGVVATGEELHVRGGRAGEFRFLLDGIELHEPIRDTPMELPLAALRSAELVTGAPDAEYGGALAGVLNAITVDPTERFTGALFWQTGSPASPRFDRGSLRLAGPLGIAGLGAVLVTEGTLADPSYPVLRSAGRAQILGGSFGWRTDNHELGYLKIAPVGVGPPFALELIANRRVARPFDPMWSLDGWTTPELSPGNPGPGFSPDPVAGWGRYRAADHKTITDDRRIAAILTASRTRERERWSGALGWTRARTLTSLGGFDDESYLTKVRGPVFGLPDHTTSDPFHVYFGDEPYYRRARSDVVSLRADYERFPARGPSLKAGVGARHERVDLREIDASTWGTGIDSLRSYSARAPGGYAYAQVRWGFEGLVLNAGLRLEYFTAGHADGIQSFGSDTGSVWSLSPRLGVAYPISTRDVFSIAYVRIQQDPARDFLYDNRRLINNREPLGNPALLPSTVISYQGAIKHLVNERWSAQAAVFFRDLYDQIGARNFEAPFTPVQLRYENSDVGHAAGFELSLFHDGEGDQRTELHYTYLDAEGTESFENGMPFYLRAGVRPTPIGDHLLSWDQTHTIAFTTTRRTASWSLGWTTIAASGLPWTPAVRRQLPVDLSLVNSRRFKWSENSVARLEWTPRPLRGRVRLGCEVLNVFDTRLETAATADGYPNRDINNTYDDYGAFRTETGRPGGAYWNDANGDGLPGWVPIHDPRLFAPPRSVRFTIGLD